MIRLHTNHGTITLELDAEKAPNTVKNFLVPRTSTRVIGALM